MKKKWLIVLAVVVILVAVAGVGAWKMGLFEKLFGPKYKIETEAAYFAAPGRELMATVESREAAEKLAALYGIELVNYADGVAEFTTDQPLGEVINKGKEEGYPELSVNYTRKAY